MKKNIIKNQYTQQTLEACYYFFSALKDVDILDYAYLKAPDSFNDVLQNAKIFGYYLFTDEVNIINNFSEKLKNYLSEIEDLIEIGPGPEFSVYHKTLSILTYAPHLKHYYALDISKEYLEKTRHIIHENRPDIKITTIEFDFIKDSVSILKPLLNPKRKKAYIFLGSTMSNYVKHKQEWIIKQFSDMLKPGEILLIGLDTNQNQTEIIKAYDTPYVKDMIYSSLEYFCDQFPEIQHCRNFLQTQVSFDKKTKQVILLFKVMQDFTIHLPKHETLYLKKGQKLKGGILQKYSVEQVIELVKPYFQIEDILDYTNKTRIFICQRKNL